MRFLSLWFPIIIMQSDINAAWSMSSNESSYQCPHPNHVLLTMKWPQHKSYSDSFALFHLAKLQLCPQHSMHNIKLEEFPWWWICLIHSWNISLVIKKVIISTVKKIKDHSNCRIYNQMSVTRPLLPFVQMMNRQPWNLVPKDYCCTY